MTHDPHRVTALQRWFRDEALPLWTGAGLDPASGTAWEELDATGAPCVDMVRRLRVQARQAYALTLAGADDRDPALLDPAQTLFRFVMDRGFDPRTDRLAALLNPDLTIRTAPHDLYDLTFVLLAAAGLIRAGIDVQDDLTRLETALDQLAAPQGWYEDADHRLPRRQNPHMHLFEASTALFEATGADRFRDIAQACLDLLRNVFLRPDGQILEFFDADWRPLTGDAQAIEPGHMVEWVYLIDRFETVTGQPAGVDLSALFAAALDMRDGFGLLPDRLGADTRRMWPQTELLKAALVMRRRNLLSAADADLPERVLDAMSQDYLSDRVPGGWIDSRGTDGTLLSDAMPASTFYHIAVAFRLYIFDGERI